MAAKMPASEGEVLISEPHGRGESHQDQPLIKPDPEEIAEIVISEEDESDVTMVEPQAASTPRSECPSPPKKQATGEKEMSTPQRDTALPRRVKMEDILPSRYEMLTADNNWVY